MSVYNTKNINLLKKSVNSIIQQSYKDWELIIYDDGSDDEITKSEIKNLSLLDARIKVFGDDINKGAAAARNYCISQARGKYIAIQDEDDYSEKNRLEKEVEFLDRHDEYSFVSTCANVFDEEKLWGEYVNKECPQKKDFLWTLPFIHPATMFRKKDLISVNGYRVSKETLRTEDYDLMARLYANNKKGYNIQENLYNYFISKSNKKYRPLKDRVYESISRYKIYKSLNLVFVGLPFMIKPILVGLIPQKFFKKITNNKYNTRS